MLRQVIPELEREFGKGYGHLKLAAAEAVIAELAPIQERYRQHGRCQFREILDRGSKKAATIAAATLFREQQAMGL